MLTNTHLKVLLRAERILQRQVEEGVTLRRDTPDHVVIRRLMGWSVTLMNHAEDGPYARLDYGIESLVLGRTGGH